MNFYSKKIIIVAIFVLIIGFIAGVYYFCSLNQSTVNNLKNFFDTIVFYDDKNNLWKSFIKYFKYFFFIWIMAFTKYGYYGSFSVLFIKGYELGFNVALLFKIKKLWAFIDIFKYFFIQSVGLYILLTVITLTSIKYSFILKENKKATPEYFFILILGSFLVLSISFFEIYILKFFY